MQTFMKRILLAITIIFLTSALMTQGIFAYTNNAVQTLIAEEETHDDKPLQKQIKKDWKENYTSDYRLSMLSLIKKGIFAERHVFRCCKGFALIPYTPPDIA